MCLTLPSGYLSYLISACIILPWPATTYIHTPRKRLINERCLVCHPQRQHHLSTHGRIPSALETNYLSRRLVFESRVYLRCLIRCLMVPCRYYCVYGYLLVCWHPFPLFALLSGLADGRCKGSSQELEEDFYLGNFPALPDCQTAN
ncbi:hypothetical protein F5B20DRAFT_296604 [Whalleya microplaca]|nr:hypothetical protein F5B20DRAFT_296604 [Whalleya microplaca]